MKAVHPPHRGVSRLPSVDGGRPFRLSAVPKGENMSGFSLCGGSEGRCDAQRQLVSLLIRHQLKVRLLALLPRIYALWKDYQNISMLMLVSVGDALCWLDAEPARFGGFDSAAVALACL